MLSLSILVNNVHANLFEYITGLKIDDLGKSYKNDH